MESNQPWRANANSLLVVYSILAATCGVFIALIFQDTSICRYWWVPIISLVIAFGLFVFSAEGLTDALDEDDIEKYLSLLFIYNVATGLLFSGVATSIYLHYIFPTYHSAWLFICVFLLPGGRWFYFAGWFIFSSKKRYEEYKKELITGKVKILRYWSGLFLWVRKLLHK